MKILKLIKCRLIGHDVSDDYTDGGHWVCKHCGSHSYYDFELDKWSKTPILLIPKSIFKNIIMKITAYKHRNDLPF